MTNKLNQIAVTLNDSSLALIAKYNSDEFLTKEENDNAIANFFKQFENSDKVKTNVIGYLYNIDGDKVGIVMESYIDSGSDDYYYTSYYTA